MSALACPACGESPLAASPGCTSAHEVASVSTEASFSSGNFAPVQVVAKKKAPAKWRGQSFVYMNKAGERYAVYHRNASGTMSWEHGYSSREGCVACS